MIPKTIVEYEREHMDAGYKRTAGPVLAHIDKMATSPTSEMQISLSSLDQEAQGLTEKDAPLLPTNKKLEKALNALGSVFISAQALIEAAGPAIQQSGAALAPQAVTAKVFLNVTDDLIAKGIDPLSSKAASRYVAAINKTKGKFNVLSAKDIAANFVNTPKWKSKMDGWGVGYHAKTKDMFIQGLADGWSPKYSAAKLREVAENIPYSAAENLTRTLHNTSYREASLEMEKINGGMIYGKVRIATLDQRTCLSCIALHGTELEPGERVDDHYRGRCTEFYRVPGGDMFPESMQADSTPGHRNFVPFQKGTDWFKSLPPERQALQRSFVSTPAKFRAYQDGTPLSAFVGNHVDPVFGNQAIEKSLLGTIGSDAKKYYSSIPASSIPKGIQYSRIMEDEFDDVLAQVGSWDGDRAVIGVGALRKFRDKTSRLIVGREGSVVTSVISHDVTSFVSRPGKERVRADYINLSFLATKGKGYGRSSMQEVVNYAASIYSGIILESAPDAVGFYEKLGMHNYGYLKFYLSPDEVLKYAAP